MLYKGVWVHSKCRKTFPKECTFFWICQHARKVGSEAQEAASAFLSMEEYISLSAHSSIADILPSLIKISTPLTFRVDLPKYSTLFPAWLLSVSTHNYLYLDPYFWMENIELEEAVVTYYIPLVFRVNCRANTTSNIHHSMIKWEINNWHSETHLWGYRG